MTEYPLNLISNDNEEVVSNAHELLRERPFTKHNYSLDQDARRFIPSEELVNAINASIAVGTPLLLTGEPGTGKTQTAHYIAYKLGLEPVIPFQVKSDSSAQDLLYHFDAVAYLHEAYIQKNGSNTKKESFDQLTKEIRDVGINIKSPSG